MNSVSSNKKDGIFIIAGGGTGGHIFPAIAIANAIKKTLPTATFLFIGAKGKMEMEKVPQAGYKIVGLDIAGFNRSSLLKNITLPFKIIKSFFQVASIFKKHKVQAVIGVGGYSSFPVLKYAQQKGIPTFIHESNSFAGKSNIMLGKNATAVFTASDNMQQFFPADKITNTGNPVRQNISNSVVNKSEALLFFNLKENKKTVLVIGGSLGAKSINEAINKSINEFEANDLQLIWQTGKPYFETANQAATSKTNVYVKDFITQMEMAYAAADVVISRSGAMAVAEICLIGKPVIFVPYPFAAEDHQTVNAKALVNKNAALIVADANAATELLPTLINLTKNEDLQNTLKQNIAKLAVKNADEVIAQKIITILNLV
jgi:UDP-N-acetylglucosamine--N-acetylmuramyl-(pentapeptide) pyrophosphoryl-undecaprenol N-acetylglucosamine transferase